jgi:hypothetical protein
MVDDPPIYAVGYQPEDVEKQAQVVAWPMVLEVGLTLPRVPLYLRDTECIQLDLEATYMETRRLARVK